MALNAMRGFGKVFKYFGNSRTILSTSSKSTFSLRENVSNARTITRSLFFLSGNTKGPDQDNSSAIQVAAAWSNACSCCCNMHTKGDKELVAFLEEEITNESNAHKSRVVSELDQFECKYDEAEITLTKNFNNEIITIKANINHSVDTEEDIEDPSEAKEEPAAEMKSKPDFTVEITKKDKTLAFECSFTEIPSEEGGESYNDAFQITEISFYEGEIKDNTYSVSGEIMDGYLYDLLMNFLEERGVSNNLADKLVTLFTSHEHKMYISLLQRMKKFVEK